MAYLLAGRSSTVVSGPRHWVSSDTVASLGSHAAQAALDDAGMKLKEIDVLITAGGTRDQHIPVASSTDPGANARW